MLLLQAALIFALSPSTIHSYYHEPSPPPPYQSTPRPVEQTTTTSPPNSQPAKTWNVIVSFKNSSHHILNTIKQQSFQNRTERVNSVVHCLKAHAVVTHKELLVFLSGIEGVKTISIWAANQVFAQWVPLDVVEEMKTMSYVSKVEEEFFIQVPPFNPTALTHAKPATIDDFFEWGISKIQAPEAWDIGTKGSGILIASIDTGVRGTHEALRDRFVGDRGWFDPRTSSAEPFDDIGHGTHTMGTIIGSGGIGVAPDAQWMSCKGCNVGGCSNVDLIRCGQWILCPTDTDGNGDCGRTPSLVSCSFGGGRGQTWYNSITDAWIAANICPIFSIGNDGPDCGTADSPGDQNVISVGASTGTDGLADFSSRGPPERSNPRNPDIKIKPDIVAPGVLIRSSINTGDSDYAVLQGTSMACPHVSGSVALLQSFNRIINKNSSLTYSATKSLLFGGAVQTGLGLVTGNLNCGGIVATLFPNNHFGHGRLNVLNSMKNLQMSNELCRIMKH